MDNPREKPASKRHDDPVTPGLGESWNFWRAIEERNLPKAERHWSVISRISALDQGTQKEVKYALESLRREVHDSHPLLGNAPAHLKTSVSEKEQKESTPEVQLKAVSVILSALGKNNIDSALSVLSQLPHALDRAKVLCTLLGGDHVPSDPPQLKGTHHLLNAEGRHATIGSVVGRRTVRDSVVSALIRRHYELLGRSL
jgi:uncharacterized protein (DUF2249 family)